MERRDVLRFSSLAAGGVALASASKVAAFAQSNKGAAPGGAKKQTDNEFSNIMADCARACEICIAHCQTLLAQGDTMLADCLKKCLELVPLCDATETLLNYKSVYAAKIAKICLEACQACAESCKPHIAHHQQCKACYEACLKCIEACKSM